MAFLGILQRLKERESKMNRKKIVTGLLCMAGLLPVCAQQRVLSVDEMFRLADTNSRSIRSHRLAVDETKQGIKTAKSVINCLLSRQIYRSVISETVG